jgi:hypothetical protein
MSVMKRMRGKNHIRQIRRIVRQQFKIGAEEVTTMREMSGVDDGEDMMDQEKILEYEDT